MIKVTKGTEPDRLKNLRERCIREGLSDGEAYKKLKNPLKSQVRNQMIGEQGQLCAYCMCRIPRADVEEGIAPIKIEHIDPRNPSDRHSNGQGLAYSNLLAVCNGNATRKDSAHPHSHEQLTCDAHKGNIEFRKINPCDENTLSSIFYDIEGNIFAKDEDVQFDLVSTLNLNCEDSPLRSERESALGELIEDMSQIDSENLLEYCKMTKEAFLQENNPKTPYVGILLWYLEDLEKALSMERITSYGEFK